MPSSGSFLRQLSGREGWKTTSKRWVVGNNKYGSGSNGYGSESSVNQMEGLGMYGSENGGSGFAARKRVMVLVDQSSTSKHAMLWALTHVTNKGDLLTLLHVIPPQRASESSYSPYLASSLGSHCKECKPEVEVEALVIQGPRLATVLSQVKKLEVSVLVLGQDKPSPLLSCLCGSSSRDEFVEQCISSADCMTIGVRKQSRGMGGYLISTRWQKNFWLLA
ncbi:UspA [Dillenia turbinata]|uniref:UspA n=1 Tax=Dillenia turbinata TaxID=194707 RepID=A0AAN8ZLG6_9MAGN